MKANVLFLFYALFTLHETLALNHDWNSRLNDHIMFVDDVRARLRELSIDELQKMIERVKAFELEKKLEEQRQNLLREEERMKKQLEEARRQIQMKSFIERRFGTFGSFLKDFFFK
jgi:hypothetical protein